MDLATLARNFIGSEHGQQAAAAAAAAAPYVMAFLKSHIGG